MHLKRSYQLELLDQAEIPFDDILLNMQELNTINTLLGGHAITVKGFKQLLGKRKKISVCEIGCGGGDNLVAILKYCKINNVDVKLIGVDLKQECIDVAKNNFFLKVNTSFICSDYTLVQFQEKPDIIFSSLFCHHFNEEQLIIQLKWMRHNALLGFFINDLQRHWLAHISIKILTQLFSKSYLVKNDAPLSVLRGFLKKEWTAIFNKALIEKFEIHWKWAFRYLIIYKHT
jgi:2-polyprenyl-3-methyl-5-hydroxy-6-metoxy-1,4-benzoquinol methylase